MKQAGPYKILPGTNLLSTQTLLPGRPDPIRTNAEARRTTTTIPKQQQKRRDRRLIAMSHSF